MNYILYINKNKHIKCMPLTYDGFFYGMQSAIDEDYFILGMFQQAKRVDAEIYTVDGASFTDEPSDYCDNFYQQTFINSDQMQTEVDEKYFTNSGVKLWFSLNATNWGSSNISDAVRDLIQEYRYGIDRPLGKSITYCSGEPDLPINIPYIKIEYWDNTHGLYISLTSSGGTLSSILIDEAQVKDVFMWGLKMSIPAIKTKLKGIKIYPSLGLVCYNQENNFQNFGTYCMVENLRIELIGI